MKDHLPILFAFFKWSAKVINISIVIVRFVLKAAETNLLIVPLLNADPGRGASHATRHDHPHRTAHLPAAFEALRQPTDQCKVMVAL